MFPEIADTGKLLTVRGLGRRHGAGCLDCRRLTGPTAGTNVCSTCGAVVALADVDLDLAPGEILGVIGESGSGKSSLVRLLCFDESPTWGRAVLWPPGSDLGSATGIDLFALDAAARGRLRAGGLGVVYQNPQLGLDLSVSCSGNVAEKVLVADAAAGRLPTYAAIRSRARELLGRTEVPVARMDELPRRFSGGMQQRVQIAKALACDPPLLLLDEVTTGLDVSVQARLLDLILELQHRLGVAMIVVTHDLGVARLLAGRTVVMQHGRIVESGLTDQILEDPQHAYTQRLVAAAL